MEIRFSLVSMISRALLLTRQRGFLDALFDAFDTSGQTRIEKMKHIFKKIEMGELNDCEEELRAIILRHIQ